MKTIDWPDTITSPQTQLLGLINWVGIIDCPAKSLSVRLLRFLCLPDRSAPLLIGRIKSLGFIDLCRVTMQKAQSVWLGGLLKC